MANTILLKGRDKVTRKEFAAGTAINPGYLIKLAADGAVDPHAVAGAKVPNMYAFENELEGGVITHAYAVNEQVLCMVCSSGVEILARLAANAVAIVIGDLLESAGDGTLRLATVGGEGVRASVTIGAADAQVLYTAAQIGDEGNDITIEYIAGTAATQTVVVTGNAIVIKSDTTTPGTTDQAADIISLVNGDAEASALVVAGVGTGSGADAVVTPVAATNLAGGVDSGGVNAAMAMAIEAVDNSAVGVEAFIKVEVM